MVGNLRAVKRNCPEEIRNSNIDNSGGVAGCLLPGVVPEILNKSEFTKPKIQNGQGLICNAMSHLLVSCAPFFLATRPEKRRGRIFDPSFFATFSVFRSSVFLVAAKDCAAFMSVDPV